MVGSQARQPNFWVRHRDERLCAEDCLWTICQCQCLLSTPTWYAPQCLKLVVAEIRKWEGHDILVMFDKGVSYTASHCHLSRMPFERSSSSGSSYISVRGLGRVTISKCTMISLIGAPRYLQIRCPVSKETQMLPPS